MMAREVVYLSTCNFMVHTKFFLYLVKSLDKLKYNRLIELGNRGVLRCYA